MDFKEEIHFKPSIVLQTLEQFELIVDYLDQKEPDDYYLMVQDMSKEKFKSKKLNRELLGNLSFVHF